MPGVFIPTREVLTLLPGIMEGIAGPEALESLFDDNESLPDLKLIDELCSNLIEVCPFKS